jgi:hypothetical protein
MREIFLLDGDAGGNWQDRALCAQTDSEAFFPERGVQPVRRKSVPKL